MISTVPTDRILRTITISSPQSQESSWCIVCYVDQ